MKRLLPAVLTVLALVAALLAFSSPAPAVADTGSSWGSATAERQTLREGCRSYPFHYRIDVPGDTWMAEITLANPAGTNIATLTYESGRQPAAGTGRFRFCDVSTRPGRHTIRLKITSYDFRDQSVRRSAPTTFRLVHR
ncbi:hypothetical protein [Nocardioides rubriscoriae]|uniref:hypothetical protein n=1 Tax=Nocardioides rubriscoriae TaxID=642762 RepID=UPI0011E0003F|nr:hypothetical protein [Nocardioides rubriscoriae]